ncbi:MAG: ABC transporter permease [Anaerolineae bacterium]|nr:ABC transporter permease [Anaerolineae bacterium]
MARDLARSVKGVSEEERIFVATQWQLMWWKFRRHKLAVAGTIAILLMYGLALFCEFIGPYEPELTFIKYKLAPPSPVHIRDAEGNWHWPFVYRIVRTKDPETLRNLYDEDTTTRYPIRFFVHSTPVRYWGIFEWDLHLFGLDVPHEEQGVFLFGADRLGRDLFTRLCYGARVSLSIGLVGVFLSTTIGILLGGVSGYYGGLVDTAVQRVIEFLRNIPTLPLWMALSAAVPPHWPILRVYFAINIILSLQGWTGMAQVTRSRFLSLREEDFVMAAKLCGTSEMRIIIRHMVPAFTSYIIASLTLSVPGMILGETSLSFLGLGLRPPAISWGVLLQEANNLRSLVLAWWVLLPGVAVVIAVTAFNFFGDGLRDAADPYSR